MKLIAIGAAVAGSLLFASAASAAALFTEDFSGYNPTTIAHDAHFASNGTNTINSDYNYRKPIGESHSGQADSMYDEGTWTIATNPFAVHDLWIDQDQPNNPFLIVNGNTTPGVTAYESNAVAVGPGAYSFSYQILNVCCNGNHSDGVPSFLQLWYFKGTDPSTPVGPLNIGSTINTLGSGDGWFTVSGTFNITAPGGFVRLGLSDFNGAADGNDFGVDNISLNSVPEPAAWALMIGGFGLAGAALRRRRAATA
jgi:PEP-CTERM motif-containing protein